MKSIAIFQSDLRVGGIQKALLNFITSLDGEEYQVDLYLFDKDNFYQTTLPKYVTTYYLPSLKYYTRFIKFGMLFRIFAKNFLPINLSKKCYDVAIDFNGYRNECALGALYVQAAKRVLWIHSDFKMKWENEKRYRVSWFFSKGKFKKFDAFAAVSQGAADSFQEMVSGMQKPIWIIPNFIDKDEILQKSNQPVNFVTDSHFLNFVSVGRLSATKGYDDLIEMMGRIHKKRPDIRLYILGDGPIREHLKNQINQLHLEQVVFLLGNQKNPYAFMKKMDAFVLNSRYEGQGIVIQEARCIGLPVFIPKRLEKYNPMIEGYEDLESAILHAENCLKKEDDLSAYNQQSLRQVIELLQKH